MSDADRTTALADALIDAADSTTVRETRIVEVGVGRRTAVAQSLVDRGAIVVVTDVVDRSVPDAADGDHDRHTFVRDDVTDPDPSVYRDADLLYALRLPPELHGSLAGLADGLGIPAAFTTLGGDPPAVPADPLQLPETTLFRNVEPDRSRARSPYPRTRPIARNTAHDDEQRP